MNVIIYNRRGERIDFISDHSGQLKLCFPDGTEGKVSIGSLILPVKNGYAHMYVSQLEDGVYSPCLYSSGNILRLEAVRIFGKEVDVMRTEDYIIRSLLERMQLVESKLKTASGRIDNLAQKIYGNGLFEESENFEQSEEQNECNEYKF